MIAVTGRNVQILAILVLLGLSLGDPNNDAEVDNYWAKKRVHNLLLSLPQEVKDRIQGTADDYFKMLEIDNTQGVTNNRGYNAGRQRAARARKVDSCTKVSTSKRRGIVNVNYYVNKIQQPSNYLFPEEQPRSQQQPQPHSQPLPGFHPPDDNSNDDDEYDDNNDDNYGWQ